MGKVIESLKSANEDIRIVAMQTLLEIGRQEYDSMQYYIQAIIGITAELAKNDVERVGALAIEFWT